MAVTLTGIRGVVFDLDDTLFPEREFVLSGLRAAGDWLRSQVDCPVDPARRLQELFDSGRRERLFDHLLAEWGCPDAERLLPGMVACYREHPAAIKLYPDAQRAIDRWRGLFRLGVITDGPLAAQRGKLEALRLAAHADPLICTDQWGTAFWKPHARAFEEIERVWALAGPCCVYIGDNPTKDFVAPNRLGWHTIQISRPIGEYRNVDTAPGGEPAHHIESFDEVDLSS
jgi:putative hydrolase of the HAD superfamily